MAPSRLIIGVAGRPHPAEVVSGDAHTIQWAGDVCRIAVIDGLGHGPDAADAAGRAVATLEAHPALAPAEALQRCHAALSGTRGAAISIASLDLARGEVAYAGIGNVEAHIWRGCRRERLIVYRGIVGSAMRTVRTFTAPLSLAEEWVFMMHTDGLSARADIYAVDLAPPWEPDAVAQALVERYGRLQDDALVIVVRPRHAPG
ncbi:MAG: SpoIIE family protein phosphatase [Chloroflexota bacterium]